MINNFIMSNLWTVLVIVPFFLDPPELEDALKMDKITGAGFAGLDDKALEYSWYVLHHVNERQVVTDWLIDQVLLRCIPGQGKISRIRVSNGLCIYWCHHWHVSVSNWRCIATDQILD